MTVEKPSGLVGALDGAFFDRPSPSVAQDLIGKILWREGVGGGRLTEVEAYLPEGDPACHAACGMTKRNEAMFGPAGHIYVYLSYGVHVLLNIVCDREGRGSAVLIRSFEPVGDVSQLEANRALRGTGRARSRSARCDISRGPGRVGQALALGLELNGLPLGTPSGLWVYDDGKAAQVVLSERIGISKGGHLPLRFCLAGSPYVSHSGRRREGEHG